MIPVTKPFLPPKYEYQLLLDGIWEREWLTNNGPLVQQLESALKAYLGTESCLYVSNGTIAIQLAIKAAALSGEIITTPFSYVATTSSLVWENCTPVYVDIDPHTLNIDPAKIEQSITDKTTGILATHVFGNPCDIDAIAKIASKHNLTVIYDAAHCFGTTFKGKSVFEFGDISTASFHATKLYHTVEGGGVFTNNEALLSRMFYMRNFGHDGPEKFNGVGINAKNSEYHAAMGLCMLPYMKDVLERRKAQFEYYRRELKSCPVTLQQLHPESEINCSYFPVLFASEDTAIHVKKSLEQHQIFTRRYFYPSLNTLSYVDGNAPVSEDVAKRILCMPLYHELTEEEQDKILQIIKKVVGLR